MIPKPEPEPTSYFLLEQRRRALENEAEISLVYPPLPASSPWASDPVGKEPLINREEDKSHG
jgi:hypothetical protein